MKFRNLFRKNTALLAAAVVSSLFLAGCSGETEINTETQKFNSGSKETAKTSKSELVPFKLGYLPSTGHLLYFVAKEEGFFEEEGLDVSLSNFDGNTEIVMSVESGKLDAAAIGSTSCINYIAQGAKLQIIGGIMKEGHALVVKPELVEGVDPKDYSLELLRGKTIANVNLGITDIVYRNVFENMGWEIGKDVYFENLESAGLESLLNNSIDAVSVYTPFRALAEKKGYVIINYSGQNEPFGDHPCCRNLASTELIEQHPERYISYLKALIKAYKFYQENEDETCEDIAKYCDTDIDLIRSETYGKYISSTPDPELKAIWIWYDALLSGGYIEEFDLAASVNTDLYLQALKEISEAEPDEQLWKDLLKHFDEFNVNYTREDYFDIYDDNWKFTGGAKS